MVKKTVNTTSSSGLIAMTIILLVLSIVVMVFDYQKKIPFIRNTIQTYASLPIKRASSWPHGLTDNISTLWRDRIELQEENAQLKKEVAWLKANLANQNILEAEYRRLKSLLESTTTRTRPVIIAEVLDSQIDANKHQIEINKGKNAAVFEGQVVIDENGVVGQITGLSDNASVVSLITDERQRIPVFVERNRLRMISRGSGNLSQLEMEFVDKGADIRVGDKLVTSGLGKRYPRGYGVAVVSHVKSSPANEFMEVYAKPLASLDKVLEVLLIQPVSADYLAPKSRLDNQRKDKDKSNN